MCVCVCVHVCVHVCVTGESKRKQSSSIMTASVIFLRKQGVFVCACVCV